MSNIFSVLIKKAITSKIPHCIYILSQIQSPWSMILLIWILYWKRESGYTPLWSETIMDNLLSIKLLRYEKT